jgi:hypothetical protein
MKKATYLIATMFASLALFGCVETVPPPVVVSEPHPAATVVTPGSAVAVPPGSAAIVTTPEY